MDCRDEGNVVAAVQRAKEEGGVPSEICLSSYNNDEPRLSPEPIDFLKSEGFGKGIFKTSCRSLLSESTVPSLLPCDSESFREDDLDKIFLPMKDDARRWSIPSIRMSNQLENLDDDDDDDDLSLASSIDTTMMIEGTRECDNFAAVFDVADACKIEQQAEPISCDDSAYRTAEAPYEWLSKITDWKGEMLEDVSDSDFFTATSRQQP